MAASIMLPLMCVAIEIGSSIFSFGKEFQKRRPITHAIDRTHAAVGIRIEMAKNELSTLITLVLKLFKSEFLLSNMKNSGKINTELEIALMNTI